MIRKNWRIRPGSELAGELARSVGVSKIVAQLLINRGMVTPRDAVAFLRADFTDLYNPFLMKDMEAAALRVSAAIKRGEKIRIYGDYDVDGITSTALLIMVLRKFGARVDWYIPHRLDEGYGLNLEAVRKAACDGVSLLITVDCGITACAEVEAASELGIDVIITDHHEPQSRIPRALAVVDPKRSDCSYPFRDLAGVGVAFKLAQAVSTILGGMFDGARLAGDYLDLVALGTIADVAPLVGENRIIAKYGLQGLQATRNHGIKALLAVSGLGQGAGGVNGGSVNSVNGDTSSNGNSNNGNGNDSNVSDGGIRGSGGERSLTAWHVSFLLAPRINAAGRIGSPDFALELLLSEDPKRAGELAYMLDAENQARQDLETAILREAIARITEDGLERDKVIVLAREGWHPGVIGIVASRVVEEYSRPAILIALDGEEGKGSGRSIASFNLHQALTMCEDLLERHGGHALAAGLGIRRENLDAFRRRINEVADGLISECDLVPEIEVDAKLGLAEVSLDLVSELEALAPFGAGNPYPLFVCDDMSVLEYRTVGGEGRHLKLKLGAGNVVHDAIAFGMGSIAADLFGTGAGIGTGFRARRVEAVFALEENIWNGRRSCQLNIKDIRPLVE
ncbi:MAG TPA: DHH family phosphoesterase [Firmicutes bacterium]|nr:DHH family phosphoesterase [Bacillota bacterium]